MLQEDYATGTEGGCPFCCWLVEGASRLGPAVADPGGRACCCCWRRTCCWTSCCWAICGVAAISGACL